MVDGIDRAFVASSTKTAFLNGDIFRGHTGMDKSKCCYHFSFSIEIDAYELYL